MKSKIGTYENMSKKVREIVNRVQESHPMVGNISGEDALWRSLTLDSNRDLNQLTQRRMQDIAFYLYDSNPMAKRVVDIVADFCIGDGFTYKAEDDDVFEVIDNFWNDPDNNLSESMYDNVSELSLYGENCFPIWVNPIDGAVKIGYIDPSTIIKIKKKKDNPRINDSIIWRKPKGKNVYTLKIINHDKKTGMLQGDCFYFSINKPIAAARGRSDLLSLADWLDGHDQFLFARLERAFLLNTFVWDITCEGMNREELEEFVKSIPTDHRPGSLRAHNEKVTFNVIAPKLEGQDASNEARLFKNQILGGAGYPEHWFAEGSKTTRATAQEMGLPTLKKLRRRQKIIKFQYDKMINFVIDMAIQAGTLSKKVNRKFELIPSPIVTKDNKGLAESMNGFVQSLIAASDKQWVTDEEAKTAIKIMISQIGASAFTSEKKEEEEEEKEKQEPQETPEIPEEPEEVATDEG